MPILFLNVETVLQIHENQIALYGGDATVRDQSLLKSAIGMPEQAFGGQFLHEFPFGMAAAYCFHLVSNHPFVDGNKRTGFASSLAFLDLNELRLAADRDSGYEMVLKVARGEMPKADVIEFYRRHVVPK
jgi:death on curing protein